MNKIKEETMKMLKEDITKLFKTIVQERTEQVKYSINNSDTDFRKYYKLSNSFINLCRTYNSQLSNKSTNKIYMNNLVLLINDEIKEIHILMNEYQNLQEQYSTLSSVFNNLIKLTDELPEVPKEDIIAYRHPIKVLDTNKIKNLEDVKRVLKFLNITASWNQSDDVPSESFDEVQDLFQDYKNDIN